MSTCWLLIMPATAVCHETASTAATISAGPASRRTERGDALQGGAPSRADGISGLRLPGFPDVGSRRHWLWARVMGGGWQERSGRGCSDVQDGTG